MLVDTRSERSAGPSRARLAGLAAVAVAVAGGWWLGGVVRAPDRVEVAAPAVAVGGMQLEVAPAWTQAGAAPGPDAPGAESYAPVAGMPARALLVAGPAADASLVPTALRAQLPAQLPSPRRTKLAGLPAWTYGPISDGARVIAVTVVPTTVGVLAVACSAPTETWSAALGCEAGVRTIVSGGDALVPAPDLAFRQRAPAVLAKLDGKRVAGRAALARGRRIAAAREPRRRAPRRRPPRSPRSPLPASRPKWSRRCAARPAATTGSAGRRAARVTSARASPWGAARRPLRVRSSACGPRPRDVVGERQLRWVGKRVSAGRGEGAQVHIRRHRNPVVCRNAPYTCTTAHARFGDPSSVQLCTLAAANGHPPPHPAGLTFGNSR